MLDHGWSELERGHPRLLDRVRTALAEFSGQSVSPGRVQEALDAARIDESTRLLLVNDAWIPYGETAGNAKSPAPAPTPIAWKAAMRANDMAALRAGAHSGPLRGTVTIGGQRHVALAYPWQHPEGFLLMHRPVSAILTRPEALQEPLLPAALITFVWTAGILGVMAYLVLTRLHDRIARKSAESETAALRHTESMARMRDAVIFGLAKLTESRDPETGQHLERISLYCTKLAQALRHHPKYRQLITPEFVRLIGISSILHDIGKVGIEDSILLKPGPLTPLERHRMQEHSAIGGICIQDIERRLGSSNFLQMARQIAFSHHERWDGEGYPQGLKGHDIPLAARVVAIADVYEALSTKRVYKEAVPHDQCVAYIRDQSGKQFDPALVEVFLKHESQFRDIGRRYADAHNPQSTGNDSKGSIKAAAAASDRLTTADLTCVH